MNWRSLTCVVLAFCIILTVVWLIPFNVPLDMDYVLTMFRALGEEPLPSIFGTFEFGDSKILNIGEGVVNTLYITTFPIRWIKYCANQIFTIYIFMTGGV